MLDPKHISAYLKRIGFDGDLTPSLELLATLQKTHLLHIPFENLDIHYDRPITLDFERIYEKVIHQRRGGFCYELNGLYYYLLKSLGYQVKRISARVYAAGLKLPHEYDHLAVIVTLDGKEYLTDVGYKEFAFAPLKLELDISQKDERGHFRFDQHSEGYIRVSKVSNMETLPEYVFMNVHREFSEFTQMCHFQQYDEQSHFRKQKLISVPTESGRVTLTSTKLKITENGKAHESPIHDQEEFAARLKQYFGMVIH